MIKKNRIWIDVLGIVLACVLFTLGMETMRVSGAANHQRMFMQFALLTFSYLLLLFIFSKKDKFLGIPSIVWTIFFGGSVWLVCHSIWGIYGDWRYISLPQTTSKDVIDRHLMMLKIGIVVTLVIDIFTLLTVLATRELGSIFFKPEPELK